MLGFELTWDGVPVVLPKTAQRLVAFLALRERPVLRSHTAEMLWLDSSESHSNGSLRTALWRLGRCGRDLIQVRGESVIISPSVTVDTHQLAELARGMWRQQHLPGARELELLIGGGELLPGWYDEWVLMERERIRQIWLQTLVAAAEQLVGAGHHAEAVVLGLIALESEPLLERAHRVIIRAHMSAGNRAEALRQYQLYADVLKRELHLDPPADVESLTTALRPDPAAGLHDR